MKLNYKLLVIVGLVVACLLPMLVKAEYNTHTITLNDMNINSITDNWVNYKVSDENQIGRVLLYEPVDENYVALTPGDIQTITDNSDPEETTIVSHTTTFSNISNKTYYLVTDPSENMEFTSLRIDGLDVDLPEPVTLSVSGTNYNAYPITIESSMSEDVVIEFWFEYINRDQFNVGKIDLTSVAEVNNDTPTIGKIKNEQNDTIATIKIKEIPNNGIPSYLNISTDSSIPNVAFDGQNNTYTAEITEMSGYQIESVFFEDGDTHGGGGVASYSRCNLTFDENNSKQVNYNLESNDTNILSDNRGYRLSVEMIDEIPANTITLKNLDSVGAGGAANIKMNEGGVVSGSVKLQKYNTNTTSWETQSIELPFTNNTKTFTGLQSDDKYRLIITPSSGYQVDQLKIDGTINNTCVDNSYDSSYVGNAYTVDAQGIATYEFTVNDNDVYVLDAKFNSSGGENPTGPPVEINKILLDNVSNISEDGKQGIYKNADNEELGRIKLYDGSTELGLVESETNPGSYYIDSVGNYKLGIIENDNYKLFSVEIFDENNSFVGEYNRNNFTSENGMITKTLENINIDKGYQIVVRFSFKTDIPNSLTIGNINTKNYDTGNGLIKQFVYNDESETDELTTVATVELFDVNGNITTHRAISKVQNYEAQNKNLPAGTYRIKITPEQGYGLESIQHILNGSTNAYNACNKAIDPLTKVITYDFTIEDNDYVYIKPIVVKKLPDFKINIGGTNVFDASNYNFTDDATQTVYTDPDNNFVINRVASNDKSVNGFRYELVFAEDGTSDYIETTGAGFLGIVIKGDSNTINANSDGYSIKGDLSDDNSLLMGIIENPESNLSDNILNMSGGIYADYVETNGKTLIVNNGNNSTYSTKGIHAGVVELNNKTYNIYSSASIFEGLDDNENQLKLNSNSGVVLNAYSNSTDAAMINVDYAKVSENAYNHIENLSESGSLGTFSKQVFYYGNNNLQQQNQEFNNLLGEEEELAETSDNSLGYNYSITNRVLNLRSLAGRMINLIAEGTYTNGNVLVTNGNGHRDTLYDSTSKNSRRFNLHSAGKDSLGDVIDINTTATIKPNYGYQIKEHSFNIEGIDTDLTSQTTPGVYKFPTPPTYSNNENLDFTTKDDNKLNVQFEEISGDKLNTTDNSDIFSFTESDPVVFNETEKLFGKVNITLSDISTPTNSSSWVNEAGTNEIQNYFKIELKNNIKKYGTDTYWEDINTSSNESNIKLLLNSDLEDKANYKILYEDPSDGSIKTITPTYNRTDNILEFNTSKYTNFAVATIDGSAPASPTLVNEWSNKNKIIMNWDEVEDATGYNVYRSTNGGTYEKLTGNQTKLSSKMYYTDNTIVEGNTYSYKVTGYTTLYGVDFESDYSNTINFDATSTKPMLVRQWKNASQNIMSWQEIEGTSSYKVYRSTNGGSFVELPGVTFSGTGTKYFTDNTIESNNSYSYKITSFKNINNETIESDYSNTIEFTLGLTKPLLINEWSNNSKNIISWDVVENTESYQVYRKASNENEYSKLNVSQNNTPSKKYLIDNTIDSSKTYSYKVNAIKTVNGNSIEGTDSNVEVFVPNSTTPTLNKEWKTNSKIIISWDKIINATGYYLYRSVNQNSEDSYEKIENAVISDGATKKYYEDSSITPGCNYFYKVKAYKIVNGVEYEGEFSSPLIVDSFYNTTPTLRYLWRNYYQIAMNWTPITGATGYLVYRSTGGAYSPYKYTSSTSLTDTNLKTGQRYYYKVIAYKHVNNLDVSSEESNYFSAVPYLLTPSISLSKSGSSSIKVKWGKVPGAYKYQIYRKQKGKSWKRIKTLSSSKRSYTNKVTKGKKYYYKIRVYRTVSGKNIYSAFSTTKSKKR